MKALRERQKEELSKVRLLPPPPPSLWGRPWASKASSLDKGTMHLCVPNSRLREMRNGGQRLNSIFLSPQVTSNLGKMILKEEMEKSLPIRRKTRSLPDRTPFQACECCCVRCWDSIHCWSP